MKKIPTIFKRNPENMHELLNQPHLDCQWVFNGEGIATRKYDGTCVLIEYDGSYWKRREIKEGKTVPDGFISISTDLNTGKTVGWVVVDSLQKDNKWHMEAFQENLLPGTYELLGPKIQGNPEKVTKHLLKKHSEATHYPNAPRTFKGLCDWFGKMDIEGIVFHHPDGRMAKIKKRDFGLKRT